MQRWHRDRQLMLRRWRMELAKHGDGDPHSRRGGYPRYALAPSSLAASVDCHCADGIGTMRKATPFGHRHHACPFCNPDKFLPKARGTAKRRAIAFDLTAEG